MTYQNGELGIVGIQGAEGLLDEDDLPLWVLQSGQWILFLDGSHWKAA